jgi:hypothetical protein
MTSLPCYTMVTLCLTLAQSASPGPQFSATQPESLDQLARQVERQLDSTDARSVAWGAYSAGVYQLTSTVRVLQRILGSPPATTALERRALLDAVLDALIQLNAHLPASLVRSDMSTSGPCTPSYC